MDSKDESDYLSGECKRLSEKIKAAHTKGGMKQVVARGENIKTRIAVNGGVED